jgi:nanoRNase/pAp phosphatase (c-di-AMP/oligoRNAs hydrolase)
MNSELDVHEQTKDIFDKASKVLLCINNRSSFDTHFAAVALKKYLESEGKNVIVAANGELILKHKRMFEQEGVECSPELQPLNYVITIDHAEGNIERVSYDDKDGKFHLYITPVEGSEEFDFKKVSYSQGGGGIDTVIVFGCRSLKWLGDIYEANQELFDTLPVVNINNLPGEQEYGTAKVVDESLSVCELLFKVLALDSSPVSKPISNLLLSGIVEHLQPFQGSPYKAASVEVVTDLVKKGADLKGAFKQLYFDHTYENFEVDRKVMNNFKFDAATGVAWSSVSELDLTQCGVNRDTFILNGRIVFNTCSDFKVAFVLYEVQSGEIVVELESNRQDIDAKELLSNFKVAGTSARIFFTVRDKTLADVEESVIKAISRRISTSGPAKPVEMKEFDRTESDTEVEPRKKGKSVDREELSPKSVEKALEKAHPVSKGLVVPPPISADEG